MTPNNILTNIKSIIFLFSFIVILPLGMNAQRMGHSSSRGGGGRTMSRPTTTRPATSRPTTTRPSTTRPTTNNRSINGGHTKTTTRPSTRPTTNNKAVNRGSSNKANTNNRATNNKKTTNNRSTTNKKTNNIKNSGNKIDNSKRNINIDNSKNVNINRNNTRVNASSRRYTRPPYRYGGHRYYCHRPYYYHPYRPFYWGPVWHPWGFFVATLATTAIIVSIENQKYHYDSGVYYVSSSGGYTVVQAPVGATVQTLPKETEKVEVNETTNNYYYGGAFYSKSDEGYTVVPATAGTIVPSLPEGGEEVKIGDVTYVQFGDTYYQPIQVDGKNMYEIVEVKEDE